MLHGFFTCVMDRIDRRATSQQQHPTELIARELNDMKNGLFVDKRGTKRWYKDDKYHREDGPAIEWFDGGRDWYKGGLRHREDGPAVEDIGYKRWWYKGFYAGEGDAPDPVLWERLTSFEANGGPLLNGCIVDLNSVEWWYKDDKCHREDGPAVDCPDGHQVWWLYGKFLGADADGFWALWDLLTPEQRGNPTLLRYMPR